MILNFMRGLNIKLLLVGCYEFLKLFLGILVWYNLVFSVFLFKFGGFWYFLVVRCVLLEFVNLDN